VPVYFPMFFLPSHTGISTCLAKGKDYLYRKLLPFN
jgi:hypothetical protein